MKEYLSIDELARDLPALALPVRGQLIGHDNLFALTLEEGGSWCVRIHDGLVSVEECSAQGAVCTVYAKEKDLLAMMAGRLSPAKALLLRKVRISGNPSSLLGLLALLDDA